MFSQFEIVELNNSLDIFSYGQGNQERLTKLSTTTLDFLSNLDLNKSGNFISSLINIIKNYNASSIPRPLYKRILNIPASNRDIINSYTNIKNKIISLSTDLEVEYNKLVRLITYYEKFYSDYIKEYSVLENNIQTLEKYISNNKNDNIKEDLGKRLIDLKLTKQITMQKIVNVKIVYENNKILLEKIHLLINNTIPLWEDTLHRLITINQYNDLFISDEFESINQDITTLMNESIITIKKIDDAKEKVVKDNVI